MGTIMRLKNTILVKDTSSGSQSKKYLETDMLLESGLLT